MSSQELSFGIKGGYNAANVKADGIFDKESRSGFHVGLYLENRFSDFLALQTELLYSQQGFTLKDQNDVEFKQDVDYLNLPVLLKFYVIPGLYAEAGPQIGYAINDNQEFDTGLIEINNQGDLDSFDYGLAFGAGLKLINGVVIGARYNIGLGDLYEGDDDFKNRVFQVFLGLEL